MQCFSLQHNAVVSSEYIRSTAILGDFVSSLSSKSVLFRGIGQVVDNNNILAVKVLKGNPTSYSADPTADIEDFPENAGTDTILVSSIQARNNARLVFAGSLELFSNTFFGLQFGNRLFCNELSKWVFGESGQLFF